ncbi:tetratricopeptide repeat protein [Telmatospirillum siberiense]|uniref:protein O-GlcNAc transferase n=1 Tax=Telmatospirillum siberiense TaxID=382514 RepID=A0A2N3PMB8_9PROT|nr:glycosyltransferase family 41 protein [Telmatospirillum siberiense]PKU21535.1 glycosyltransferase [Telmatospirillum siberiense]
MVDSPLARSARQPVPYAAPSPSGPSTPSGPSARQASAPLRRGRKFHEQGVALAKQNRWKPALEAFRQAARVLPAHPGFHYAVGVALCRLDRFAEAIEAFHREIAINPGHGPAVAEIGTCLARTGRPREGISYLREGLRLFPSMPLAQYSLGLALLTEDRRAEAMEALDKALAMDGAYAQAYRTRGLAYAMDGQFERSVADLQAASALDNSNYQAILELGVTFGKAERNLQAAQLFEMAAKAAPDVALPHYIYGQFLINHRQFERGLLAIDRALELDPLHAESHVGRGFGYLGQGRIEEAVAAFRRAGELRPGEAAIAGTLLFALQHKPGVTRDELLREHRKWAALYRRPLVTGRLAFANDADPERLPRIGIVSADMHRHAVAFLTVRAFEQLAARGFPIVGFSTARPDIDDDMTDRFKAASVAWHGVNGRDDDEVMRLIAEERIDILFDLAGHTAGNRLGIFARRAAPVQVGWAGYVGTVGLDSYDGLIADAVEIPPDHDSSYVEPVIRLPDCYVCYQPPTDPPEVTPLPGPTTGHVTFGCFNRPAKLNSRLAGLWARILEQVPNSRLLLVYGGLGEGATQKALSAVLGAGGVPLDRVDMVGETEQARLLDAYGRVDLALDPSPYSGGVTTLEAMWMGVPTVTLVGDTFAGRHAASHLTAAGLAEFCAATEDDYVALAVDWSRRPEALATLRRTLRDRLAASPLCDAPGFAGNLGRELTRLWRDWCAGKTKG